MHVSLAAHRGVAELGVSADVLRAPLTRDHQVVPETERNRSVVRAAHPVRDDDVELELRALAGTQDDVPVEVVRRTTAKRRPRERVPDAVEAAKAAEPDVALDLAGADVPDLERVRGPLADVDAQRRTYEAARELEDVGARNDRNGFRVHRGSLSIHDDGRGGDDEGQQERNERNTRTVHQDSFGKGGCEVLPGGSVLPQPPE